MGECFISALSALAALSVVMLVLLSVGIQPSYILWKMTRLNAA